MTKNEAISIAIRGTRLLSAKRFSSLLDYMEIYSMAYQDALDELEQYKQAIAILEGLKDKEE